MSDLTTGMKLGIFSDTHGDKVPHWDGLALDAVLFAGDAYDCIRPKEGANSAHLRRLVESCRAPVLAVRGNHDYHDMGGFFQAAEDISGRLYRLWPGLWVAGVGFASKHHYDLPGETDIQPQCRILVRMAQRQVMSGERVILLTHYSPNLPDLPDLPAGEARADWMYHCLADLVETLHPIAIVQGHVHRWFGRQWRRTDGSLIVSPGPVGGILSITVNGKVMFAASEGT